MDHLEAVERLYVAAVWADFALQQEKAVSAELRNAKFTHAALAHHLNHLTTAATMLRDAYSLCAFVEAWLEAIHPTPSAALDLYHPLTSELWALTNATHAAIGHTADVLRERLAILRDFYAAPVKAIGDLLPRIRDAVRDAPVAPYQAPAPSTVPTRGITP